METFFASLASASVTLIVCIINNRSQNNKTRALMDELTERVNKHNSLIERTYRLEEDVALHEEKIKVVNHRLEDLENGR